MSPVGVCGVRAPLTRHDTLSCPHRARAGRGGTGRVQAAARRSPAWRRGADSVDVEEAECCGHDHHVTALGAAALRLW
eukprot:scaffold8311_cov71-Phaeocystis_antarctica.AAC.2